MTKAILEFDLNDLDDKMSHLRAIKSLDLITALYDISNWMRDIEKYGKEPMTKDDFWEILKSYNINFDDLY